MQFRWSLLLQNETSPFLFQMRMFSKINNGSEDDTVEAELMERGSEQENESWDSEDDDGEGQENT